MSEASTFEMMARLVLSLAVVLGLMWVMAYVMKRRGLAPGLRRGQRSTAEVELLARKPLGRNASIAIVRAGGRTMVVGITDQHVTKLDDADVDEIDLETTDGQWTAATKEPAGSGQARKTMLDHVRERTVRR